MIYKGLGTVHLDIFLFSMLFYSLVIKWRFVDRITLQMEKFKEVFGSLLCLFDDILPETVY